MSYYTGTPNQFRLDPPFSSTCPDTLGLYLNSPNLIVRGREVSIIAQSEVYILPSVGRVEGSEIARCIVWEGYENMQVKELDCQAYYYKGVCVHSQTK